MHTADQTAPASKTALWAGRIASALVVMFLIFDGVIKLMEIGPVLESFAELGYPASQARGIGILVLACCLLYAIPRTSVLGAILVTGLLGGAITSHVRVGDPVFSHVLFGAYIGVFAWGGLFLRDVRLRALLPVRR